MPDELGTIDTTGYCYFTISKETWAPGIWVGVQNIYVMVENTPVCVTFVNLETRTVYHKVDENGPYNLKTGDKIYTWKKE